MKAFVSTTSFLKPGGAAARELLESFFHEIVYNELGVPLKGAQILDKLDGCDAYIAGLDYITRDVIEKMPPTLKVISRYGVGVDRVDLAAASERGIAVTNTPGANARAVCELAFALMLAAARNLPALHNAVEAGAWPRSQGFELGGKTLGILGLGAIGKLLALRAKAFEMRVVAYDPYFDQAFGKAHGIQNLPLEELLPQAHILSLHLPLNEETRYLMDARRIAMLPRGALLINTAQGGLLHEAAAAEALKSGQLGGLGLDAFEEEPLGDSPLKGLPRVVFTPHTGAHTEEAVHNMAMLSVRNAIDVLSGRPCPHLLQHP